MKLSKYWYLVVLSLFLVVVAGCGDDNNGGATGAFTFTSQKDVALGATVTSNSITVSGLTADSPISVTGGLYSIGTGAFTATAGTVTNGQTVRVQHTASASNSTATTTTLTIGGASAKFTSTTVAGTGGTGGDTSAGQALFTSACGGCHTASALSKTTVAAIKADNMSKGLTDTQLQQVVDYLATK